MRFINCVRKTIDYDLKTLVYIGRIIILDGRTIIYNRRTTDYIAIIIFYVARTINAVGKIENDYRKTSTFLLFAFSESTIPSFIKIVFCENEAS